MENFSTLHRTRIAPRRWKTTCALLAALCVAATLPVLAGSSPKNKSRVGERYFWVALGGFETGETSVVLGRSSGGSSLAAGAGWRFQRFLSVELDVKLADTDYELPAELRRSGSHDDEVTLATAGFLGNLKLGPGSGRFRPYVGVGLGFGTVDLSLSESYGYYSQPLEIEFSTLSQLIAGFDVRVGRRFHLGVDYAQLEAHRGIEIAGDEIDGGGDSVALVLRVSF